MLLFALTSQCGSLLPVVDLASVLTPEIMAPILANPEVQQRLMPYLPSGESLPQSSEELQNTLSSPQFQQVDVLYSFFFLNREELTVPFKVIQFPHLSFKTAVALFFFYYSVWFMLCHIISTFVAPVAVSG